MLKRIEKVQFNTNCVVGLHVYVWGNVSGIWGNVSRIRGDVSGISGDVSEIWGDATGLSGIVEELVSTAPAR